MTGASARAGVPARASGSFALRLLALTGAQSLRPGKEQTMYDEEGYEYFDDELDYRLEFADPGGNSALRAATKDNPRNLPCPTCGWPNRLTPADRARGYQCDSCANANERGMDIDYYDGGEDDDEE